MKNRVCSWLVCKLGVRQDSTLSKPFIPSSPPAPPPRAASCVGSTPALSPANPSWRRWRDHPRSSTCFNGVESYRFCPFHFIGFSMGKTNSSCENVLWHVYTYMYVCLQVWTWLQALHINVCLFACSGLASGPTRHYKTLNDFSSPKVEDLKTKPNKILLRIETFKI